MRRLAILAAGAIALAAPSAAQAGCNFNMGFFPNGRGVAGFGIGCSDGNRGYGGYPPGYGVPVPAVPLRTIIAPSCRQWMAEIKTLHDAHGRVLSQRETGRGYWRSC